MEDTATHTNDDHDSMFHSSTTTCATDTADKSLLNKTMDTIIVDHDNYTDDEDDDYIFHMYQLQTEMVILRRQNCALMQQVQTMDCREECTQKRIAKLENTMAELLRYINTSTEGDDS